MSEVETGSSSVGIMELEEIAAMVEGFVRELWEPGISVEDAGHYRRCYAEWRDLMLEMSGHLRARRWLDFRACRDKAAVLELAYDVRPYTEEITHHVVLYIQRGLVKVRGI